MRIFYPVFMMMVLVVAYILSVFFGEQFQAQNKGATDRVVITPPVQVIAYLGDRYLASNIEMFRVAATGLTPRLDTGQLDGSYLLRAYNAASKLNPCHEDAYYLANAVLAFGGGYEEANAVLSRATDCRYWDFLPPFLYGFNQYFFIRDVPSAQAALELAADRSSENEMLLRRFAILIGAEEFDDEQMALQYLKQQQAETTSERLKTSLQERIERIEGLIILREARKEFEVKFNRPLNRPSELVESGILDILPVDPLGLGYKYTQGEFVLNEIEIKGLERPQ